MKPIDLRDISEVYHVEDESQIVILPAGAMVVPDNPARYGISHAQYLRDHGLAEFQRAYRAGELPKIVWGGETVEVNCE